LVNDFIAPRNPQIAFSIDTLELAHDLIMGSGISRQAIGDALHRNLERKNNLRLPPLRKVFEYAYTYWMRAKLVCEDRSLAILQQDNSNEHSLRDDSLLYRPLQDLCPACFARDKGDEGLIIFSVDGNFQQSRFIREGQKVDQTIQGRLFIPNTPSISAIKDTDQYTLESGCGNTFKAAGSNDKPKSFERKDETGLMGAVCRHGHPLRYLNMFAGEQYAPTIALVASVINSVPSNAKVILQYDIACKFEPFIRRVNPDIYSRFSAFALNAFHSYAHELLCQLLYSPLRIVGLGLSDGEGNERDWAIKAPFVKSNRSSSSETRQLILESQSLYQADLMIQMLGLKLQRWWSVAKKVIEEQDIRLAQIQLLLPTVTDLRQWAEDKEKSARMFFTSDQYDRLQTRADRLRPFIQNKKEVDLLRQKIDEAKTHADPAVLPSLLEEYRTLGIELQNRRQFHIDKDEFKGWKADENEVYTEWEKHAIWLRLNNT